MKPIKKIKLKKSTISNLNEMEMNSLKGGWSEAYVGSCPCLDTGQPSSKTTENYELCRRSIGGCH